MGGEGEIPGCWVKGAGFSLEVGSQFIQQSKCFFVQHLTFVQNL